MDIWSSCLEKTKKKMGITQYGFVQGSLFKETQRAYCAVISQGGSGKK